MPQFTSNVTVLPNDTITPAINEMAGNVMKMEQFKAVEQEKRDAKLAELAAVSLGNIFAEDNADLQGSKKGYIDEVAKYSAEYKGRIPWDKQAELMAKKQELLQKAASSEEHRKEYIDVMKKTATDPNIDKEETFSALQEWSKTPLLDRPSAWNVIQPRTSLTEVFKKNINVNPEESTYVKGNELHSVEKFQSLPQMMAIISENQLYQNKVSKEMQQAGIKKPANGYTGEQIGTYLQATYGPMFDKDQDIIKSVRAPRTSVTIGSREPAPEGQGGTATIKANLVIGGKTTLQDMPVSYINEQSTPQRVMRFPGTDYFDVSAYDGFSTGTVSPEMKVVAIRDTPVVYIGKTKNNKKPGWYLVTDGQLDPSSKDYNEYVANNVQYKPYFWGTHTSSEQDGNKTVKTERQYAVPATKANMDAFKSTKATSSWSRQHGDFSAPGAGGSTDADYQKFYEQNKGGKYTEAELKAYYNEYIKK